MVEHKAGRSGKYKTLKLGIGFLLLVSFLFWVIYEIDQRLEEPSILDYLFSVPEYVFLGLVFAGIIWVIVDAARKR